MKRVNGQPWTPWEQDRHLPIRGLVDDLKEMAIAIRVAYKELQAKLGR
jgi:hypothetical protein